MKKFLRAGGALLAALWVNSVSFGATTYRLIDLTPNGMVDMTPGGIVPGEQFASSFDPARKAWLIHGSSGSAIDLTPAGFISSHAGASDGVRQVGDGGIGNVAHALLWNGSAQDYVDLHPAGKTSSLGWGISGNTQCGEADGHAYLWHNTAASAVDINPTGFADSIAINCSATQQVGWGDDAVGAKALLWSGTAASAVNLHPGSAYVYSMARDVAGGMQVGEAIVGGGANHAMLWRGTAASKVDLHPLFGWSQSQANGTNGISQVGFVNTGVMYHAVMWNGTAASMVDLHTGIVPAEFKYSMAELIDSDGEILGTMFNDTQHRHLVMWQPISVPEPGGMMGVAMVAVSIAGRRRAAD